MLLPSNSTYGDGFYSWTIPKDILCGHYNIMVRSTSDGSNHDVGASPFRVACRTTYEITVTVTNPPLTNAQLVLNGESFDTLRALFLYFFNLFFGPSFPFHDQTTDGSTAWLHLFLRRHRRLLYGPSEWKHIQVNLSWQFKWFFHTGVYEKFARRPGNYLLCNLFSFLAECRSLANKKFPSVSQKVSVSIKDKSDESLDGIFGFGVKSTLSINCAVQSYCSACYEATGKIIET